MLCLLFGALFLSIFLEKGTRRIAVQQFNQQQLLLAQYAARQLEHKMELVAAELQVLNYSPAIQYLEDVAWAKRMEMSMTILGKVGALTIRRLDPAQSRMYEVNDQGQSTTSSLAADFASSELLRQAALPENRGKVLLGEMIQPLPGKLLLAMTVPTYQDSVDPAHPIASGQLTGMLQVVLDVSGFVGRTVGDISSGQTGYGWVIDHHGTFLYHPLPEFIGANAFAARTQKEPKISFDRINLIQREKMLAGEAGTSWYVSGWHGRKAGPIKKLIAYFPVRLAEFQTPEIWSVAVVAPIEEVEEVIRREVSRWHILHGVIVLAIILVGLGAYASERRWKKRLAGEVAAKTSRLARSEERYRCLVENAQDIIYTLDETGSILSINSYGRNFFTAAAPPRTASLPGRSLFELLTSKELSFAGLAKAFATGDPLRFEHAAEIEALALFAEGVELSRLCNQIGRASCRERV